MDVCLAGGPCLGLSRPGYRGPDRPDPFIDHVILRDTSELRYLRGQYFLVASSWLLTRPHHQISDGSVTGEEFAGTDPDSLKEDIGDVLREGLEIFDVGKMVDRYAHHSVAFCFQVRCPNLILREGSCIVVMLVAVIFDDELLGLDAQIRIVGSLRFGTVDPLIELHSSEGTAS